MNDERGGVAGMDIIQLNLIDKECKKGKHYLAPTPHRHLVATLWQPRAQSLF